MDYAKPSPLLSSFVKCYWAVESCSSQHQQYNQRIIPSGLPELIFYLRNRPFIEDHNRSIAENTVVAGLQNTFYDIQVSGSLSLFAIQFKPHGLAMFLDIPASEFFNRNIPLKFILKHETERMEDLLSQAVSFPEKVRTTETFLLSRLHQKKTYDNQRLSHSIGLINQLRGVAQVGFLASEACLSRKQYERFFLRNIGTSPKQFLKILRFQDAISRKSENETAKLTEITYKCGYYDQAHMINDFRKMAGMSPKQYFRKCEPHSDYFQ